MIMIKGPAGQLNVRGMGNWGNEQVNNKGTSSDELWYNINSHGGLFSFLALERNIAIAHMPGCP